MEFKNNSARGGGATESSSSGGSRTHRDGDEGGGGGRRYPPSKSHRDEGVSKGQKSKRRPEPDRSSSFRSGRAGDKRYDESGGKDYHESGKRASDTRQSDDPRLAGYVRRLTRDDDYDKKYGTICQLRDYLLQSENRSVILKASDSLLSCLWDLLLERGMRDVKHEAALSLGVLGYMMAGESDRYFTWLFTKLNSTPSEDCKLLLLDSLLETVQRDAPSGNETLTQYMPMLMSKCQSLLENADTPELLQAVVKVIKVIVKSNPRSFARHFHDTVDILVGWHIDTTQKENVIDFTSNALVEFRQFWTDDLNFSVNLLTQFLEDTEAYVQELGLVVSGQVIAEGDVLPAAASIAKIAALIKVFTTVVRCIQDDPTVDNSYLAELFERLIRCIEVVFHNGFDEKAFIAANVCLTVLMSKIGAECLLVKTALMDLIVIQVERKTERGPTYPYLTSLLSLIYKTIEVLNTNLTTDFISRLLGIDSLLPLLCFAHNKEVLQLLLKIYKAVMNLKSVPLLQEGYRLVLAHLESAYNALLSAASSSEDRDSSDGDHSCHLVTTNPIDAKMYAGREAEAIVIFSLCVIAEIGNAKSNLFGMWALDPSIFHLLSCRLLPLNVGLMSEYPSIHFALLQALNSHCSRHNQFVLSSSLVTKKSFQDSANMIASVGATNAGHFSAILTLLTEFLHSEMIPSDSLLLVLRWVQDTCEGVVQTNVVYFSDEFQRLMSAVLTIGFNPQRDVTTLACQILQVYLRNIDKYPNDFLNGCQELCCIRLTDADNEVSHAYFDLLRLLPIGSSTRMVSSLIGRDDGMRPIYLHKESYGEAYWLVRSRHMTRVPGGNFHTHNFTEIMSYVLHDTPLQTDGSRFSWLERVFESCQRWERDSGGKEELNPLSLIIDRNEQLLIFWSTWEAAQFCILSKLRTPLGKPQDTFTAIEGSVKQFVAQLTRGSKEQGGEETGTTQDSEPPSGVQSSDEKMLGDSLRVRMLLQFMEHLEKHLYNAYEGCAVAMVNPPKVVRTFFRTNRGTCLEWLARVRLSTVLVARACNEPALVVRHTSELLREMCDNHNIQSVEFDRMLVFLVEALCKLRAPEAVQGLFIWVRDITGGRKINWIKAAIDLASAKYETASASLSSSLRVYLTTDPAGMGSGADSDASSGSLLGSPFTSSLHSSRGPGVGGVTRVTVLNKNQPQASSAMGAGAQRGREPAVVEFLVKQVCECYVKLGAWEDVLRWQAEMEQYQADYGTLLQGSMTTATTTTTPAATKHFDTGLDPNYVKALSKFDECDFVGAEKLFRIVPSLTQVGQSIDDARGDWEGKAWVGPQVSVGWDTSGVNEAARQWFFAALALLYGDSVTSSSSTIQCTETAVDWFTHSESLCKVALRCSSSSWPARLDHDGLLQLYKTRLCLEQLTPAADKRNDGWLTSLSRDLKFDVTEHDVSTPLTALNQLRLMNTIHRRQHPDKKFDVSGQLCRLALSAASLARRQNNFALCERLLLEQVSTVGLSSPSNDTSGDHSTAFGASAQEMLLSAFAKMNLETGTTSSVVDDHLCYRAMLEQESCKLLYARGLTHEAIDSLAASTLRTLTAADMMSVAQRKTMLASSQDLSARALLSLVKWLQTDTKFTAHIASHLRQIAMAPRSAKENISAIAESGSRDETVVPLVSRTLKRLVDMETSGMNEGKGVPLQYGRDVSFGDQPDSELLIGRLLHLSTQHCPSLAKSWFTLAGWCYKWGRKAVDNAICGSIDLTLDEKALVLELLPPGTSSESIDSIISMLGHIHTSSAGEMGGEEDISDQDLNLLCSADEADAMRRQLLAACPLLQPIDDELSVGDQSINDEMSVAGQPLGESRLDRLVYVWRTIIERVYHYYKMSAKSYFTFLQLNDGAQPTVNVDGNITATLRVLRLLVKHAGELRDVLEHGLRNSPTVPWKGIVPQLFSRLNHPEPYVHQSVCDLLCRVAQDSPHLIIYPAVVGCSTARDSGEDNQKDGLLNVYLSDGASDAGPVTAAQSGADPSSAVAVVTDLETLVVSQDEDSSGGVTGDDKTVMTQLQNCFSVILDTLAAENPRMISEVQLLVSELRRITVLWDELWLGVLTQLYPDVARHIKQLEDEVKKVTANTALTSDEAKALIRLKHNTVMKQILYTLDGVLEVTSQVTQTPHEKLFQESYSKVIQTTIYALRNPENPANTAATWLHFKQLHNSLQQRAQKRAGQLLSMEEISVKLSTLKHTSISMPGLNSTGQVVTIESIHNAVQILPTKTKPKKLVFVGSDGARYPYLFKGLEDLHLDERIMQFLTIVNNMFIKTSSIDKKLFRARHYAVTPLGARSGLIQWVNGATPMFSLYKRYQQREAAMLLAKQQQQQQSSTASAGTAAGAGGVGGVGGGVNSTNRVAQDAAVTTVPRPSELFYSKLTPLLREKGLSVDNRKDWPLSLLRTVLEELMAETPKDLLAKELWCSSGSPSEWWMMTQTYTRSTAVMSMIGYVIGLGDRHLDNVLVDLATGEVVHIDYNVCFEKGKTLRVPEKVPFRMTQNFITPLGLTGVNGTFRLACEHVLKTMRRGRETLLTLLEAFVYDPLVDWTVANEWGYTGAFYGGQNLAAGSLSTGTSRPTKKDIEREITINMFSIRIAELKAIWLANRDEMLAAIQRLQDSLSVLLKNLNEEQKQELSRDKQEQQLSYLLTAVMAAKQQQQHPIDTLSARFKEYLSAMEHKINVLELVEDKLQECEMSDTLHSYALDAVHGVKMQHMTAALSKPNVGNPLVDFPAVVDFLQGAGQGQLVPQFEQSCHELQAVVLQHRSLIRSCLDLLFSYATIISHCPRSLELNHCVHRWQQWLHELICNFNTDHIRQIQADLQSYSRDVASGSGSHFVIETERDLQAMVHDADTSLHRLLELRGQESVEPTTALLTDAQTKLALVQRYILDDMSPSHRMCVTSVLLLELCSGAKSIHAVEQNIKHADIGGGWFVDLLFSLTSNASLLLQLLLICIPTTETLCADGPGVLALDGVGVGSVCGVALGGVVPANDELRRIQNTVQAACNIFESLQTLMFNYHTVIVPEAMSAFQRNEPSVLVILSDLDSLLTTVDISHILALLDVGSVTLTTHADEILPLLVVINNMRRRFDAMQHAGTSTSGNITTPGQMLLMAFSGLFSHMEADARSLVSATRDIHIPATWYAVDVIAEGKQMTSMAESTSGLISGLLFVKQLKVISDCLHQCRLMAATLLGTAGGVCYSNVQLAQPIKSLIADYVHFKIAGVLSLVFGSSLCVAINSLHIDLDVEIENFSAAAVALLHTPAEEKPTPQYIANDLGNLLLAPSSLSPTPSSSSPHVFIEHLCTHAVDQCLRSSAFRPECLSDTSDIIGTAVATWQRADRARQMDRLIEELKVTVHRVQLQLLRYQWLHEDMLVSVGALQIGSSPRGSLMTELKKAMTTLLLYERESIEAVRSKHQQLENTVTQRLKWAAGANPTLGQTVQAFEDALRENMAIVDMESSLSMDIVKIMKGILHYEALTTRTNEAVQADAAFRELINKCEVCSVLQDKCNAVVSQIEIELMETWMSSLSENQERTVEILQTIQQQLETKQKELVLHLDATRAQINECKESVAVELSNTRIVLSIHHKLVSDMRVILKAVAKQEERDYGTSCEHDGVRAYLSRYKSFSECFTTLLKLGQDADNEMTTTTSAKLLYEEMDMMMPGLVGQINSVYNELVALAPSISPDGQTVVPMPRKIVLSDDRISVQLNTTTAVTAVSQAARTSANQQGAVKDKVIRDPRTGKAIQERNSYAVGVWRKVKAKLDGKNSAEATRRMTVAEQVDMVISEATNMDNLAALYEGWTPWV